MKRWYYRILPVFSLIMAIFWGYMAWKNYKSGDKGETIIMLIVCIMFTIGFVGSLLVKVLKK